MPYTEFPTDPVVNVHWHKKKNGNGPPPEDIWPCGAFEHGYGKYDNATGKYHFFERPGNSIFILAQWNIYGIGYDTGSAPKPFKPYNYWWSTADYLGSVINGNDVPYVWNSPGSWTVTVDVPTVEDRFYRKWHDLGENVTFNSDSISIQEFRNLNIQALNETGDPPVVPDRAVGGNTITIMNITEGEIYPPGFRVRYKATIGSGPELDYDETYPPSTIQAHCEQETTGGYPPRPQPPQFHSVPLQYPAPGLSYWPLRPPPPPPFPPPSSEHR